MKCNNRSLVGIVAITLGLIVHGQAQTTLTNGLVAYFPFDGNANDTSGYGNNGEVKGASLTADRFGVANGAYHFDQNGYITVPSSPSLKITGTAITLAAWVKPSQFSGLGGRRTILRKMSQAGNVGGYLLAITDTGLLSFAGRVGLDTGFDMTARLGAVPLNAWSHVAVEYDGTNVRYFLNGLLMDTIPLTGSITADDDSLAIGRLSDSYDSSHFYGDIEEVRIYNRTLSDCELQQLGSLGLDFGLVAHFPLDGNSNDTSGQGNNGEVKGASLTADRFGGANGAYHFDPNGYIVVPSSPSLEITGTAITLAAWVKPSQFSGAGNRRTILRKMSQAGNVGGYLLAIANDGLLSFSGRFGFNIGFDLTARLGAVPLNAWSHVAVGYDGSNIRYFLNGLLVDTIPLTGSITADDDALVIGRLSELYDSEHFYGDIEEVRIYNRTLSDLDVQQLYGPRVALIKAVKPSFANLSPGTRYQLQVSPDSKTWTNHGEPLVATCASMTYTENWEVETWGSLFFRVQVVP